MLPGDTAGSGSPVLRSARFGVHAMGRGGGGGRGRPEVRSLVRFAQFNLQSAAWPRHRFDAIFCRNVVIYFDREAQQRLADRLAQALVPGGLLLVGHAESFPASHPAFRSCGLTAYELRVE